MPIVTPDTSGTVHAMTKSKSSTNDADGGKQFAAALDAATKAADRSSAARSTENMSESEPVTGTESAVDSAEARTARENEASSAEETTGATETETSSDDATATTPTPAPIVTLTDPDAMPAAMPNDASTETVEPVVASAAVSVSAVEPNAATQNPSTTVVASLNELSETPDAGTTTAAPVEAEASPVFTGPTLETADTATSGPVRTPTDTTPTISTNASAVTPVDTAADLAMVDGAQPAPGTGIPTTSAATPDGPDNSVELDPGTRPGATIADSNTSEPDATEVVTAGTDVPGATNRPTEMPPATSSDTTDPLSSTVMTKVMESANKNVLDMATNTQNPVTAPTSTVANVAPTASSTTSPTALAAPYRQVVEIVSPLRHRGDGDYTVTLQLQPEHLGRVEIAVTLTAGQISMQLTSDNAAARQLLKDAIDDLRQSLQSAGLETGSLDVNAGSTGNRDNNATASSGNGRVPADYVMEEATFFSRLGATSISTPSVDGALDVRI